MKTSVSSINRRSLFRNGMVLAAAAPFVVTLQAMAIRQALAAVAPAPAPSPYGPIAPVKDQATGLALLQLPPGFRYQSFSWTGDRMVDGRSVPGMHDGMGVVAVNRGRHADEIVLIRNHEAGTGAPIIAPGIYDDVMLPDGRRLAGGNTNIHFPRAGRGEIRTIASLGGTRTNCAGGVTPWGSWLSCEENTADYTEVGGRKHGYVFEVALDPERTSGRPILDMGRFKHEAVAVDPRTGIVYQTEDSRNLAGYYRYIPQDPSARLGSLENGGRLQAAAVKGASQAMLLAPRLGDEYELEWVDIADPDAEPGESASGPYRQAKAAGALTMSRGEGIWYYDGKVFIVDTSAGRNVAGEAGYGEGCVWMHDIATNRLTCIFASHDAVLANNPDNITVSPRGGVLLCEDGGGVEDEFGFGERLMGVTEGGEAFVFCKNNAVFSDAEAAAADKSVAGGDYRGQEFAGACFDPSGHFLFVNIQRPGITFAITGPWGRGPF